MGLKETLAKKLAAHREELKKLASEHGRNTIGEVAVEQVLGGGRGIPSLLCDTSSVPADKGLIIRGRPIAELTEKLPEEVFYLLITGELPKGDAEVNEIRAEFAKRSEVPGYVWKVLDAMPADSHPMCMLCTAILCMQRESVFAKRYAEGMAKDEYWTATLEDALNILARITGIAAGIYRKRFGKGERIPNNPKLGWAGNYVHMLGLNDASGDLTKLMRLYLVLHSDHESGNVSAATGATVNSALSDMYYTLSAALDGLAGPLHGLANQECLTWVQQVCEKYGGVPTVAQVTKEAEETLAAHRVIPGYGHAVLRVTDPRFTAFVEFGKKHCPDSKYLRTVLNVFEAVPKVLQKHPKIKNPWPNVDAASGSLLYHYGLTEQTYYTVLFSVGRALGIAAQAVVARGLGLPIVRPKSVTTNWLKEAVIK